MPPANALALGPPTLPELPGDFAEVMASDPDRGLRILLLNVQERAKLYFDLRARHATLAEWAGAKE